MYSVEEGGKTLKNDKRKSRNIEITFDTKKKSRTKVSSQRKLFADQYSLDNRNYATTKDGHNGLIVSFRGQKRHEINISYSGKKIKT